jgi:hypothetical protein
LKSGKRIPETEKISSGRKTRMRTCSAATRVYALQIQAKLSLQSQREALDNPLPPAPKGFAAVAMIAHARKENLFR